MAFAPYQSSCGYTQRAARFVTRLAVVALAFSTCSVATSVSGAESRADVGDLGAPPADSDVKQTLTDLYNAGHPPDWQIDVQLVGPILVGQPTMHPNPPPDPWCVRCGYPDQGASLMYPVMATASVTSTQGLVSSALPSSSVVHTTTTMYNGTPCPGQTVAQYCPAYFFYRDSAGRWRVA
ncbi:hypothetical protein BN975_01803 [Mycolicibacterium farcinogenes]|uniref:Uncharacterized protein n=1 Tax=Mycolicibacterium senegalense TaxID=1796 RepID=A0A378W355_9MYCO|nr:MULTISPECIES: hypothetical protein [Mycolicibacterium]CDP84794.1 hypothetical protein BN975_01803 [Mycolicibacterium farcinogenes]SUA27455.1 Uncharacterised protein [Mycolicibacterium senegalense]